LYNGETKLEFRDRKEFSGSILKQLDEAYEYISLQNKVESNFKGLNRIDKEDYPYYAIREALVNAVVHRDYTYSGSTLIHIFEDRMEFVSIGVTKQYYQNCLNLLNI
jgi:ATP-dependent DNA helicase RecG